MKHDNKFDERIDRTKAPELRLLGRALFEVMDTAAGVKFWFEEHGLTATADNVTTMTALVLDREEVLAERHNDAESQAHG